MSLLLKNRDYAADGSGGGAAPPTAPSPSAVLPATAAPPPPKVRPAPGSPGFRRRSRRPAPPLRGISRRKAVPAAGTVRFYVDQAGETATQVPQGTVCAAAQSPSCSRLTRIPATLTPSSPSSASTAYCNARLSQSEGARLEE